MDTTKAEPKAKTKAKAKKKAEPRAIDNPTFLKIKAENEKFMDVGAVVESQCREFKVPGAEGVRIFRVYGPSPSVESSVNQTYTKVYGKLLQDEDCLPEAQIVNMMIKRGVWDEQKDKRVEILQERLARLRNLVYLHGIGETATAAEIDKLAQEYDEVDEELSVLTATKSSFLANSIEHRAWEAKIKDQVWQCVFAVDGDNENLYWDSIEALGEERDKMLLGRIIHECVTFWQGVPSDFLEPLPENQNGENDTQ